MAHAIVFSHDTLLLAAEDVGDPVPASLSALTRRSCKVPKARSERPPRFAPCYAASGEVAATGSMPSGASARPIWVGRVLSTLPPAVGVWK